MAREREQCSLHEDFSLIRRSSQKNDTLHFFALLTEAGIQTSRSDSEAVLSLGTGSERKPNVFSLTGTKRDEAALFSHSVSAPADKLLFVVVVVVDQSQVSRLTPSVKVLGSSINLSC